MSKILNPRWIAEMESKIFQYKEMESKIFQREEIEEILHYRPAVQWLMTKLTKIGVPFKVINLGVGVYKVTTDTTVCPKCGGSGKI